jgi:hypothetical protein
LIRHCRNKTAIVFDTESQDGHNLLPATNDVGDFISQPSKTFSAILSAKFKSMQTALSQFQPMKLGTHYFWWHKFFRADFFWHRIFHRSIPAILLRVGNS